MIRSEDMKPHFEIGTLLKANSAFFGNNKKENGKPPSTVWLSFFPWDASSEFQNNKRSNHKIAITKGNIDFVVVDMRQGEHGVIYKLLHITENVACMCYESWAVDNLSKVKL